jgi:hypothetical protein
MVAYLDAIVVGCKEDKKPLMKFRGKSTCSVKPLRSYRNWATWTMEYLILFKTGFVQLSDRIIL